MQPFDKRLRLLMYVDGSVFPANLSAFYQVSQQPLIPIDAFAILPVFEIPLQHFSHKGNELLLLLAFQYLVYALQACIRN